MTKIRVKLHFNYVNSPHDTVLLHYKSHQVHRMLESCFLCVVFFLRAYCCLFLFVLIKMINCKCHPKLYGLDDLVSFPTLGGTEEFTSCCL